MNLRMGTGFGRIGACPHRWQTVSMNDALTIKVKPRSSKSRVELASDGSLVVCVHAPAVDDAANREVIEVIADALDVPKSAVEIVRGHKSRNKQITVAGLDAAETRARLERAAL